MYQTKKTYINADMKISELVIENPALLLMMEHFEIDVNLHAKTVLDVCKSAKINKNLFLTISNLYNGFNISENDEYLASDIILIIKFLKNSHQYYKNEKYPEVLDFIKILHLSNHSKETELVEIFFIEYFNEVKDHLDYEEKIAFPYICELLNKKKNKSKNNFSVKIYKKRHSDIESKLTDLKNLLLNHLHLKNEMSIKRKLLYSLFELEFDLGIHSIIEEKILIPLVISIEKTISNGK